VLAFMYGFWVPYDNTWMNETSAWWSSSKRYQGLSKLIREQKYSVWSEDTLQLQEKKDW